MAARRARPSLSIPAIRRRQEETSMRALYLYFAEPAEPDRDSSTVGGAWRPVHEGPLVPIQPGAYSRWKANRDRVVSENAAALHGAVNTVTVRRIRPETTG
jgi:hypothetical protein